jgi:hypothetical protein
MAQKTLKVSMIFGGAFHSFGTTLDESRVPPNLRKTKYLADPTFKPFEEIKEPLSFQEANDEDEELEPEEEEAPPPPHRPSNKRRTR